MVEEKEIPKMKFQVLAERLFKLKQLLAHEANDAYLQYDESVDSECSKHKEKFATFNKSTVVFDQFLGKFLHKNQKYISLWRVCGNNLYSFSWSKYY